MEIVDSGLINDPHRYVLIEGMPLEAGVQSQIAKEWGISPPTSKWDIADLYNKSFIEVKVSWNPVKCIDDYRVKREGLEGHCALVIIHPVTGLFHWEDHEGGLRGEEKVLGFIMARVAAMEALGISDMTVDDYTNLESFTCCSKTLNEWMKQWTEAFYNEEYYAMIEGKCETIHEPYTVTAEDLYKHLDKLDVGRFEYIKWKGKISPDGFVMNTVASSDTDYDIVDEVMQMISKSKLTPAGKPEDYSLFPDIIKSWGETASTFNFKMSESEIIKEWLGIGRKKIKFNPNTAGAKQPEYSSITPLKYHTIFDFFLGY